MTYFFNISIFGSRRKFRSVYMQSRKHISCYWSTSTRGFMMFSDGVERDQ